MALNIFLKGSEGEGVECCGEDHEFIKPEEMTLEKRMICFPIEVPPKDPIRENAEGGGCINLVRALTAPDIGK